MTPRPSGSVHPVLERLLQVGRRERRIHDERHAVTVRGVGYKLVVPS